MKTLLSCFALLALLCISGCATRPRSQAPAAYSDLSSSPSVTSTATPAPPATSPKTAPEPVPVAAEPIKNALDPHLLQPSPEPFTLGPGDALEIEILGSALS